MSLADDLRSVIDGATVAEVPEDETYALIYLPTVRHALAVVQEIERAPPDYWLNDSSRQGARQRLKAAREMLEWRDRLRGMVD